MELKNATEIISYLMMGHDPFTKEESPKESVYNSPDVIRSLVFAYNVLKPELDKQERKVKRNENKPSRQGKGWLVDEDEKLAELYKSGKSINTLAEIHERSEYAIEKRLEKLEILK